ncbi:nicotinate phosphoribosyltransferase, partial [bacterium]|nr:nicotinate phosphoribosyltransferase [bacterium]
MNRNIIVNVDSYKASHYLQYPAGTTHISSYIEARGGEFKSAVFFGLQQFIKAYLCHPITESDIVEAKAIIEAHGLPFNESGWRHILTEHNGYLPISIQALPEGSVVPVRQALVQVVNTDPECAWLTSYIETSLLRAIWYPTTVATVSWHAKQIIKRFMEKTCDSQEGLGFKLHDFGARGATSEEAAAIGGLAHLVNFSGTDTISAILQARRYYSADMPGFSIPAAEHSTMTSWGREHECDAYANMLEQFSVPGKLVAVVSDSYDLFNAIDNIWGDKLKRQIETSGGTLVIRPDSGEPVAIVCETIRRLMAKFGCTTNKKGYKVLPDYVRVIQGDGINLQSLEAILDAMTVAELSTDNIAFGMGGGLLQKVDRDTLQFAMKASSAQVNGQWRDVFKDPVTDTGKRSKKGRLAVIETETGHETLRESELNGCTNALVEVFNTGKLLVDTDFNEVRER